MDIPSGKRLHSELERSTMLSMENPLFLWPLSIAMLVYQRVTYGTMVLVGISIRIRNHCSYDILELKVITR